MNGKYSSSNLGSLFRRAKQAISFEDFAAYAPSNGAAASFVGAPCRNPNGELIGVVALQIPLDQVNRIMQDRSGLGESGETYLVGTDKLLSGGCSPVRFPVPLA